jgi:bifunctional enzyme CysN/CysC
VLVDGYDIAGGGIISMEGYANQRGLITQKSTNITKVEHGITTDARARRNGHKGGVIWLTGLSGAGKSTLAVELEKRLFEKGMNVFVLDGDNVRHGLNANLGFSPEDRAENIRRVGEVSALFAQAGAIAITSFISPYRSDRDRAREAAGEAFHEVHVAADLKTCEERDPKGLYKKARAGEIKEFTGISAPYEAPDNPQLTVDTSAGSIDDCVQQLVDYVEANFRV